VLLKIGAWETRLGDKQASGVSVSVAVALASKDFPYLTGNHVAEK